MGDAPEPLPDLHTGDLDAAGLSALFSDLERHAAVSSVTVKSSAQEYTRRQSPTLAEALEALRQRSVHGIQVRYHWDGAEWIDTILVRPNGWRVVRMNAPPARPAEA